MNKLSLLLAILLTASFAGYAQKDLTISKHGNLRKVKIKQIASQNVIVELKGPNGLPYESSIPIEDLYMIKMDKRGNMYFHPDGIRTTEEFKKKPSKADAIYLTNGFEIYGYNVHVSDRVYYTTDQSNDAWSNYMKKELPLNQVFLVVYSDGTSIIVTDLDKMTKLPSNQEAFTNEQPAADEAIEEPSETTSQLEVKFHQVAKGETLLSIAKKYGVDTKDILEWNELPAKTNPKSVIPAGMQLMIYVPIK